VIRRRTVLSSLAGCFAGMQMLQAQTLAVPTVDVKMFGALGDGVTDDSAAFQAAQAFISAQGGGTIRVPYTDRGYRIGVGTRKRRGAKNSGIVVRSHTRWIGDSGVRLIAGCRTPRGNYIFQINDAEDVEIMGFSADGQAQEQKDQPYVFASLSGVVQRVYLHHLSLYNFANFALQYADSRIDPIRARLENVAVANVHVGGVTGVTGAGSGINFFPRAQRAKKMPASKGLVLDALNIDVTNGSAEIGRHGPQCLKINNIDGIEAREISCLGGRVAGTIITNGCRNVTIRGKSSASRIGLSVDTYNNISTGRTGDILIQDWGHTKGKIIASKVDGLRLKGALQGVSIVSVRLSDADFRIADNYVNDISTGSATPSAWSFGEIEIRGGNFLSEELSADVQQPLDGLQIESLALTGRGGTNTGRVSLGGWPIRNARIRSVLLHKVDGHGLILGGFDNVVDKLEIVDGNPAGHSNAWGFVDTGKNNVVRHIILSGYAQKMTHFANISKAHAGTSIDAVSGLPRATEGLRVANQESGPPLLGSLGLSSEEIDLSVAQTTQPRFFADRDYWIASIEVIYTRASSSNLDATLSIGTTRNPKAFASFQVMQGSEVGTSRNFQNTIGKRSFRTRKLRRGTILTFRCDGDRSGTGKVRLVANLIPQR